MEGTDRLLETLLDHTHMMVAYLDPEFNFVRVNRAYAEADGRVPSFFPGKNHFDLYPNPENQEIFQGVVETGEPYFAQAKPFEYAEHPERGITYWDWSLIPVRDPAGTVTGLVLTLVNVTERELAERALSESEERLRRFMESATDSLVLWDKELNLVEANEAALKTFSPGARKMEMIGKNILELVPTLKKTGRYERYLEVIRTAKPFHVDDVILDPKFGERRVAVTAFKVGDGLGMAITDITERKLAEEALKKARDELEIRIQERTKELTQANVELEAEIVERKRAEEALRKSEEKYKTLVETSNDMIFTVDLKGRFLFTNQAFRRLLGYSTEEIKSINGFDLVHPEDLETVRAQFALLVEGKSVGHMEYRYKTKDGSYISILNNASPIFDSEGNVVAALGAARDITRRKRAEKALQESELWMRNMFNSLEEAVLVLTPDRALVNINEAAKKMFGYAKDELVDLSTEVLHVDHQHYVEFGRRLREAFDRKQPASFEFEAKRKNGEVFPTEHTVTLLKNDAGESVGIVSVVRDVTERRRAERELSQYREHLEELVERRTAELRGSNEQLAREINERKRAEEELRAEKEFTDRALNAQTDTFFVFEPSSGRAVRWNKTFVEVSGYTDEEIRSMRAPDSYYNEEDLKKAAAAAEKVLREGIVTVELSLITKDGRSIPTEYTGSAIRDGEGNPRYIIAVGRDVSERRRAEEKIKQQNEFLNNIIESLTHPFWVVDAHDYTIKAANSAALQGGLLGSSTCYALSHGRNTPCEGDEHPCPLTQVKKTKRPVAVEHIHYDKEGNPRVVQVYGYPVFDHQGDVVQMIEYSLDVTERRRAEEELRKSKELFEKTFLSQQDAIFILDAKFPPTIIDCNPSATKTFGFTRQEMLGRTTAFLHIDEAALRDFQARVYPAMEKQGFVHLPEFQLKRKDGAILQTEHALMSLTDQQGRRIGWVSVVRDITERKRAEEELQRRTYDLNERVKELNCLYNIGRLIETPGMSLERIFQGAVDLVPSAWQYPEITCARLVLGNQVLTSSNFRETAWNQVSDIMVHGKREGALEVHYLEERPERDEGPFVAEERSLLEAIVERLGRVIERKRAEEEIRKLNRSLRMQAADLAASNKELEAFSYSVSHDLRAPLRSIDGFGRALLEDYADKLDEQGKDYLNRVRAATERMRHLIDDLLNLSLMMRREIRREEIDLSKLARTIGEELRKAQPQRQVELVIQEGALAQGDTRLLREMLENLLGNAWKFTGKNPRSKIEFGVTQKEGQKVYFVRDDGAGFDMAYADKLFVPFQRLHSAGEFSGNGIGLTIASRIINRHGGQIWAEGEVEKGATFYFTLQ